MMAELKLKFVQKVRSTCELFETQSLVKARRLIHTLTLLFNGPNVVSK